MSRKARCLSVFFVGSSSALLLAASALAASGTWNGTQNSLWTNSANWSASPYPTGDQVATFNNSGNSRTTIDLTGLVRGVTNLIFDSANAAAYTIGGGDVNAQSLIFTNRSYLRLTSNVRSNQTVNARVLLGHDRSGSTHYFRNDRLGNTLMLAGEVTTTNSGGTGGAKYVSFEGSGAITVSGNMTVGGASSLTVTNVTTGPLVLSGTNRINTLILAGGDVTVSGTNRFDAIRVNTGRPVTFTGTNTLSALYLAGNAVLPAIVNIASGGTLSITNSGGDGFYATQDATINGPGALEMQGGIATDKTSNNYVAAGKTIIINAPITGASEALELWSPTGTSGTYVLNGINDFTGNVSMGPVGTLSVAMIGNKGSTTSNLGRGTTVVLNANGSRLLYTGVGETSDRTIAVNNNVSIDNSGSGHLNLSGAIAVSSGSKTLTLQGSTLGTSEFSGLLSNGSGTLSLSKVGTGTWLLTTNHTYTGSTTVNNGVLTLEGANGTLLSSTGFILAGGTLLLDNTVAANNTNRLRDASAVTLNGGTLLFSNAGGSANYSENVGVVTANAGYSTIATAQAAAGQTAILRLAGLTNAPGGAVNFVGAGLGQSDRNRIFIAGQPDGLIGPWATVGGVQLASYSSANGVCAAGEASFTDIAARGPSVIADASASNVRIASAGTSGPIELGSATTRIASLLQDTATDATVNTAGKAFQTGGVVVPDGRASVTVGVAANDGTLSSVQTNGEVVLNATGDGGVTVNAAIVNNGTATRLSKVGSGSATLAADNAFSGNTGIGGGTLVLANGNALKGSTLTSGGAVFDLSVADHAFNVGGLSGSHAQTLEDNAAPPNPVALTVGTNNASTTFSGVLSGRGSLTKVGTGTLTLSGANTYIGGTAILKGTVTASNAGSLGAGAVVNNGTLGLTAGAVTYTGLSTALSGAGTNNVTLGTGSARTYLNGDYSGFTGVWNLGIGAAPGTGRAEMNGLDNATTTINVRSNATLWCYTPGTHLAKLTLGGGDTGESYGQLRLDNNANWAGPVTLTGPVTNSADGFLGSEGGVGFISGDIGEVGGPFVVAKAGTKTLVLTGNNTFRGPFWIKNGALSISSMNSINAGAGPLGSPTSVAEGTVKIGFGTTGATLSYAGSGDTSDRVIDLAGSTGGATIDHSGTNTLTLTGGMTASGTGLKTLTLQGGTNGVGVFTGIISNGVGSPVGVVKAGTGTWILSNANTYSTNTQIKGGGTLVAAHPNALGTGFVLFPNEVGTLDLAHDGDGETPYEIYMQAGAVSTIRSNRSAPGEGLNHTLGLMHLSGVTVIVTNGANVTSGTPCVTVPYIDLYAGSAQTTTLNPTTADLIVTGGVSILQSAFDKGLVLDGTSTGSAIFGPISNGLGKVVTLTKSGIGTWTLSGSNIYSGATTLNNGQLVVSGSNGAILGTSGFTINPGTTLALVNSATTNNPNRLSDTASITLKGGMLVFTNSGAAYFTEKAGALVVNANSNVLVTSQAEVGYTSAVTFASLTRTGPGLLDFKGEGLGTDDRNRVFFAAQPPAEGLIGLWATVNGSAFAAYSNAVGVVAAGDGIFTDIPAWGPYAVADDAALDARINVQGGDAELPITLAGAGSSRLKSLMQYSDWPSTLAMTNTTLQLNDVMIAAGKQALTLGSAINEGWIMPAAAGGNVALINRSGNVLTLNAGLTNNTSASSVGKFGSGTVELAGWNSYTGPTLIDEGVLEFGGLLNQRLSGVISGAGTLTKSGTNQLQLLAANTFTGPVYINQGIVRPDQNSTFGTTNSGVFIASGATLDLGCDSSVGGTRGGDSLNMGLEPFTVSGAGVGGAGAIVCSGGQNQSIAINLISLAGDTTFGGNRRWDLRASSVLNLNGYTLTKTGINEISIFGATVHPGAGHLVVNQGQIRMEAQSVINGSSANTATVNAGGILEMYNLYGTAPAWSLTLNNGSYFRGASNGSTYGTNINVWTGPVTLNGTSFFVGNAGSVNWSVFGDISGAGSLFLTGNNSATLWLMSSNNTYSGETILSNGTLFAKYPGTLPGYAAGKLKMAGGATLTLPTGDGTTGWTALQVKDIHDQSTFQTNGATFPIVSLDTSAGDLEYPYDLTKTLGLTKNGDNDLHLGGVNGFKGPLTINRGDVLLDASANHSIGAVTIGTASLTVNNDEALFVNGTNTFLGNSAADFGRMTLMGKAAWGGPLAPYGMRSPTMYVGQSGRGVLTIQDNAVLTNNLIVGSGTGSHGAIYQRDNSTVHNWGGAGNDGRIGLSGYGYYELSGGTMTNNGYFQVGVNPASVGILAQYGGAFRMSTKYGGQLGLGRGGTGVVYVAGGDFASYIGVNVGESDNNNVNGFAEFTVDGDAEALVAGNLNLGDRTNMFATVNLNGGRLTANLFNKGNRYGSRAFLNFNGGTFRARTAGNLFNSGVNALDGVYVYPGGAVIDTTNLNVTVNASLQAPLGSGVASITIAPRGGYIGPPFVTIANGGGVGATAIAQFDSQSGSVTGVTITSPGRDYTSLPTVMLSGGGTNLQTVVTGVTLAPNASGGLTKQGSGTLTLTGTNTYGGATTLAGGTLKLAHALALPAASTITFAGGTLDLGGMTLTNAVNTTGALTGGVTNGTFQTVFSPAGEYRIGTQSYALNVRTSGVLRGTYLFDADANGACDVLAVQGNIDLSNMDLEILDLFSLDTRYPYTILTCTGTRTGTFNSANLPDDRWQLKYQPDGSVKLVYVCGTILLLR
ncbi:MAG TPA: autotransporter-associated beta strand repeat-containing protein [Kiritimatiellia bacterium]|nr:autotransporter-associated beta strand repeat-containing protein [Kiritimatiellia bacterium]HPS06541.1 autotransporter-associated beta strand repeat-containing protein [Kiritimatiellia bacterium]